MPVQITVVGAGVVGCAIAHELAARGADVHLVEGRGVGQGATRASAGILAPSHDGRNVDLQRVALRSLSMYDDFMHRVERDSGRRVEYARNGMLHVATDDAQAEALAFEARSLDEAGVACSLLDGESVRLREPALARAVAALLVPTHGYVDARGLTQALSAAAVARGARLTIANVGSLDAAAERAVVTTSEGSFEADAVVVASGSWPVTIRPTPPPAVKPIRGQLLHLDLDDPIGSLVIYGPECYLVPWRDGSVLVGATVEDAGYDERATAEGIRGLLNAAVRLAPGLGRARFREVRVGLRPKASADELPVIGQAPTMPRVFYALGHYRNGVLLAPLTAMLVADLVLEGRERGELAVVGPDRVAAG